MKYIDEFRDGELAKGLAEVIAREANPGGSPMPGSVAAWRRTSVCPPAASADHAADSSARAPGGAARKRPIAARKAEARRPST